MNKKRKTPVTVLALVLGTWVLVTAALLWTNNRPAAPVPRAELARSLERGIVWLDAHGDALLTDSNPALWWMVLATSESVGGDRRLELLLTRYLAKWMRPGSPVYPWRPLFGQDVDSGEGLLEHSFQLPGYSKYFLYTLSCDDSLGALEIIAAQSRADYCPILWIAHPHCRTHQLMGLLWGLDRGCRGPTRAVAASVRRAIWREEALDFRVDDAYVQRALMLTFAPSTSTPMNPIWMRRILANQLEDGGWDEAYPAVRLSSDRYVMIGNAGIALHDPRSTFHTTAQAVLLIARALHGDQARSPGSRSAAWASLGE